MEFKLKCKKCDKEMTFDYETFVDVSKDPEFKEKLLNGKVFVQYCECGAPQVIQYSLFYKDPDKKIAVGMLPREENDISNVEDRPATQVQAVMDDGTYTMRMVENSNDLAEKVIIFDNGYDDRIIEMVKIYYYDIMRETLEKENTGLRDMIFGVNDGKANFWVRLEDGRTMTLDLDMDMYNDIRKDLENKLDDYTPEGLAIINPQWAYTTLNDMAEEQSK